MLVTFDTKSASADHETSVGRLADGHGRQTAVVPSGLRQVTGAAAIWQAHASSTGGTMNPIINQQWTPEERARYGIRSIDDFTNEELALLQEKLVEWMRQRVPHAKNPRHRSPFVMKRRTDAPA
jgi:hypothetical protein